MTRGGSPARGGAPAPGVPDVGGERRALLVGRAVAASVGLALRTVAAIAGAALALLPAAVGRGPAGRLGPRRAGAPGGDAREEPADAPR